LKLKKKKLYEATERSVFYNYVLLLSFILEITWNL